MSQPDTAEVRAAAPLNRFSPVALRGMIRRAFVIGIFVLIAIGAYRTLTIEDAQLSSEIWRALVVDGISLGAIYGLIALGYSLVYGILLMINFAHGEVFMAGAFISFFVGDAMTRSGFVASNPLPAFIILLLVSMAASMGVAVLLERIAYRPLRNAPRLVPLITAIGASLFLQHTFRGFFGPQTRGYATISFLEGEWKLGPFQVGRVQGVTILIALAAMVALSLFVAKTKTGKAMRAVSHDKEIAALMGINVDRVVARTFMIGGLMAGLAAVMFALTFSSVQFNMGFAPGIKAFTAAVLGGIGSISGAALGGLLLGVMESVGPVLLLRGIHVPSPNQLRDVVAFSVLVLVLLIRPGGILGTGEKEKV